MAVTSLAKPGDFLTTFTFPNTSSPDAILYGVLAGGKIYRARKCKDVGTAVGGPGTWVDTGLTIADVSTPGDL